MAQLLNSAYERIARLIARGLTPQEAYKRVRNIKHDHNITRFYKRHPEIFERVSELEQLEAMGYGTALKRAQQKVGVDKAYVLMGLKEVYERAVQLRPIKGKNGEDVYVYDAKAALRALHLMGLEIGMFVQRYAQVDDPFAHLPAETLQEIMRAIGEMRRRTIAKDVQDAQILPDKLPTSEELLKEYESDETHNGTAATPVVDRETATTGN